MPPLRPSHDADHHPDHRAGRKPLEGLLHLSQLRPQDRGCARWEPGGIRQKLALLAPEAYPGADGGSRMGGMSMEWISVKDRMPEDDATYLVYGRNGYGIGFAVYYGDGEWLTCDDLTNITRFITHWMPLPESPKED